MKSIGRSVVRDAAAARAAWRGPVAAEHLQYGVYVPAYVIQFFVRFLLLSSFSVIEKELKYVRSASRISHKTRICMD